MHHVHVWRIAAAIALSLLAARACTGEGEFKAPDPPPDDLGTICAYNADCSYSCALGLQGMAPYCTRNCTPDAPCPAGYVCVSQGQMGMVCLMGSCEGDADCPEGYGCDTENSVCLHDDIACTDDADCPAATACNQGVCETVCESDEDCKQGYRCYYDTRCVECTSHAHCADDFACADGHCNTACIEDRSCRPGFECKAAVCAEIVGGGAGQLGDGCSEHTECAHFCSNQMCTEACNPDDPQSCPDGYQCHENQMFCWPG